MEQLRAIKVGPPPQECFSGPAECPVCWESIADSSAWRLFNCGHGTCGQCHDRLVQPPGKHSNCPLCRLPLVEPVSTGALPKDSTPSHLCVSTLHPQLTKERLAGVLSWSLEAAERPAMLLRHTFTDCSASLPAVSVCVDARPSQAPEGSPPDLSQLPLDAAESMNPPTTSRGVEAEDGASTAGPASTAAMLKDETAAGEQAGPQQQEFLSDSAEDAWLAQIPVFELGGAERQQTSGEAAPTVVRRFDATGRERHVH